MESTDSKTSSQVTAEHRKYFAQRLKHWQTELGLTDWRIHLSKVKAPAYALAIVWKCDLGARLASLRLCENFGVGAEVTLEELDRLALHELLHVFLARLLNTYITSQEDEEKEGAEHSVINALVHVLTKPA